MHKNADKCKLLVLEIRLSSSGSDFSGYNACDNSVLDYKSSLNLFLVLSLVQLMEIAKFLGQESQVH
jgi:hypothetical protein